MSKKGARRGDGGARGPVRKAARNGAAAGRAPRTIADRNQAFLLAFADALRDILEEERHRIAS